MFLNRLSRHIARCRCLCLLSACGLRLLRLLLNETGIDRAIAPPAGFDPEQQGEWDESIVTFEFERPIRLIKCERQADYLYIEYKFGDLGYWAFEIRPEEVKIKRI